MNNKTKILARTSSPVILSEVEGREGAQRTEQYFAMFNFLKSPLGGFRGLLLFLLLFSCQKEETPTGTNKMELGNTSFVPHSNGKQYTRQNYRQ